MTQTGPRRPPGEFKAAKGLMPPTPTRPAWVAYAIIFPVLLLALVTSPIWMGAFGALKLMKALKRRVQIVFMLPACLEVGGRFCEGYPSL
jgi:hypothetical protein